MLEDTMRTRGAAARPAVAARPARAVWLSSRAASPPMTSTSCASRSSRAGTVRRRRPARRAGATWPWRSGAQRGRRDPRAARACGAARARARDGGRARGISGAAEPRGRAARAAHRRARARRRRQRCAACATPATAGSGPWPPPPSRCRRSGRRALPRAPRALERSRAETAGPQEPWAPTAYFVALGMGRVLIVPAGVPPFLALALVRHDAFPFVEAEIEHVRALLRVAVGILGALGERSVRAPVDAPEHVAGSGHERPSPKWSTPVSLRIVLPGRASNAYLFLGTRIALVDCGSEESQRALLGGLRQLEIKRERSSLRRGHARARRARWRGCGVPGARCSSRTRSPQRSCATAKRR